MQEVDGGHTLGLNSDVSSKASAIPSDPGPCKAASERASEGRGGGAWCVRVRGSHKGALHRGGVRYTDRALIVQW